MLGSVKLYWVCNHNSSQVLVLLCIVISQSFHEALLSSSHRRPTNWPSQAFDLSYRVHVIVGFQSFGSALWDYSLSWDNGSRTTIRHFIHANAKDAYVKHMPSLCVSFQEPWSWGGIEYKVVSRVFLLPWTSLWMTSLNETHLIQIDQLGAEDSWVYKL